MTKRVKTVRTVVGDEEDEHPPDEKHSLEDEAMEDAARDFADSEQLIQLHRYDPVIGGRPRLLGGLSPSEFNGLHVMERFGGGRYFGRWKKKDGTYKRYYFDIEGPPKIAAVTEERATRQETGGAFSFLHGQSSEDEGQGSDGISAVDMLRIIAETRKEAREEMRMMIEMLRPAQPPQDATEKVFSLVEKIVPLIAQGGDGGGTSNPWLFALAQLKEPIMKAVDTIHLAVTKQTTGGPLVGAPVPDGKRLTPPPQPEPVPVEKEPEPKTENDMLLESFRGYVPLLCQAASEGKDLDLYCDLILDQVPVFGYDRLRKWLMEPGCLDQLATLDPRLAEQRNNRRERQWWEDLRALLLVALNEELGHGVRSVQPESNPDPSGGSPAPSKPGA